MNWIRQSSLRKKTRCLLLLMMVLVIMLYAGGAEASDPPFTADAPFAEDCVLIQLEDSPQGYALAQALNGFEMWAATASDSDDLSLAGGGLEIAGLGDDDIAETTEVEVKAPVLPDLGLAYTGARLLNPSGRLATEAAYMDGKMRISAASDGEGFAQRNGLEDRIFVLELGEEGRDVVEQVLAVLKDHPGIAIAEPNYYYQIDAIPNDTNYNSQQRSVMLQMSAELAWDITTGSRSITIGIIDTGLDGLHEDLIDNLWIHPDRDEMPCAYTDDDHGYDFANKIGGTPMDRDPDSHGTHVAGITGAKGNNGIGVCGMNWDVSLVWMGIQKAGSDVLLEDAAIAAIHYANTHGIGILNNSYGGPGYSEIFENAIRDYRGVFVAAAGNKAKDATYGTNNDVKKIYPACFDSPNIIAVAATDAGKKLAEFSNYGNQSVHVAAPGTVIRSTVKSNSYGSKSGTSMATPFVSGLAALVKAVHPSYTTAEIIDTLLRTAMPESELLKQGHTFPLLNAERALYIAAHGWVKVLYNFNGGMLGGTILPLIGEVYPGDQTMAPGVEPTRLDYVFDTWSEEAIRGTPFDFSTPITEDMTLYAKWIKRGDVDDNGRIDLQDVLLIFQSMRYPALLTEQQMAAADMNNDGVVDMKDVLLAYRRFRGLP